MAVSIMGLSNFAPFDYGILVPLQILFGILFYVAVSIAFKMDSFYEIIHIIKPIFAKIRRLLTKV